METINNARHSVSVTHQFHLIERLNEAKLSEVLVVVSAWYGLVGERTRAIDIQKFQKPLKAV